MQGLYKHNLPRDIKLFLAKPNREIIAPLKFAYNRTITWNEDSPSELSFALPYEINVNHKREKYKPVTQLKEKFLIKAVTNNYEEWFIIGNPNKSEDESASLTVSCLSAEQILAKKKLIEFKRTSYNPLMILNDILPGTGFKVGYINPKLNLKHREFDISSTSKLDFIYTDMTDTYEAMAVFDTVDKTVSLYEKNELSDYKGFIVNDRRYLMGIENDIDTTELVTRLHVTGSDGLGIQSVNPTGQRYIDDFSYFLYPFETDKDGNVTKRSYFMENDLAHALVKYNEYVSGRKDEFKNYLDKKAEEQQELTKLQNDLFDEDTELKTVLDSIAWMKEEGSSTSDLNKERKQLNAKIKNLNSKIKEIEKTIEKIDENIKQLGEDLKYEKHLSPFLMEQLNYFIHEDEWDDSNKIDPNDLYESGIEELKERNSPPVNISVTLANFLKDAKAENDWKRLNLSDIVRIQKPKLDIDVKVRVSSISINFDEPSIDLELSNHKELNSLENKLKSAFYTVNKVNTDYNKRKINYETVANNFNLRNDRIKEIPEEPTVGKNAIKHRKNNDGSVDITVKWTYPDYAKTDKKEHAIDGFMLYFHNDTNDEVYQFTSQMANEQITSVPYPTRTFVYPSVPADLFYTIGVRAYRRVDPDVNRDGILMSPIVRFNDGVGGFDEIESQSNSLVTALLSPITPLNDNDENDEDVSAPYRPEEEINISGRVNGTKQTTGEFPPSNPKIGDIWINTTNRTVNIWDGTKWAGNKLLDDLQVEFRDYINQVAEEDHELKEKLDKAQKDLDEAMERVDSELERIENEVVPEVEQAVKDTFIPRQDYPPDPENLPPSGMWQDITQDPPRMMRWDPELGEWVVLAPNEEEIDEMIDKVVESAKQEYREYTDEEIQKERDRIMEELDEKESVLGDKVSELLDKAEGMYDRVDEIDQELIEQQERAKQITEDLLNKADVEYVDGELRFKADASVVNKINNTVADLEETAGNLREDVLLYKDELEANNGRITSVETELDTVDGKINATITELSNVDETISKQQTQIEANSKSISFKASQDDLDEISGNVNSVSSELNILSEAVSLKAEQKFVEDLQSDFSDFQDGTNNKFQSVTKNVSELTVSVDGIVGEVSSINEAVDEQGSTINDISSTVTQHAGLIEDRVTKTVYNRDINGIISDLSSYETRIAQTEKDISFKASQDDLNSVVNTVESNSAELSIQAGKIASKVDSIYVDDVVNNIQIGGRNLIRGNSNVFNVDTISSWDNFNLHFFPEQTVDEWGATDATEIRAVGGDYTNSIRFIKTLSNYTDTVVGKIYTISIYIKNNRAYPIRVHINGFEGRPEEQVEGNEAKRVVITGERSANSLQIQVRADSKSTNVYATLWHDQLEKGNKVTDYSRAPEDTTEDISSVREYASLIEQTAQNISASLTSLQRSHDNLGEQVEKNSTDISIQAGLIEAKLDSFTYDRDKEGIIKSIQQNTLDIEITARGLESKAESTVVDKVEDTITGHTAELKALSTGLSSKVDETFVRGAIEGIEIGGRNLISNSNYFNDFIPWDNFNIHYSADEEIEGATNIRFVGGDYTSDFRGYKSLANYINDVNEGELLTFSVYVKNERDFPIYISINGLESSNFTNDRVDTLFSRNIPRFRVEPNERIRAVVTGYRASQTLQLQVRAHAEATNVYVSLWNMQIEKGTKATDYQLAPEDILSVQENHSSTIEQNSRSISLQAQSISKIEDNISNAESRIDVLSDEISQRVEQTIFNNETSSLRESISSVRQLANGIEQTVSNIEIGGQNLIREISNIFNSNTVTSWNNFNLHFYPNQTVEEWGASDTVEVRAVGGDYTSRLRFIKTLSNRVNTVVGETYTLSVYVKNNRDFPIIIHINGFEGRPEVRLDANESRRVVFTGTRSTNALQIQIRGHADNVDVHAILWRDQLEKGSMVTDYSPPFEDVNQRMTKAESSITQLSGDISLKVSKDGVSSAININPQGVLINANKMDISGVVQFINKSSDSRTVIDGGKILANSITTSQLNVNQIFGNSAVIAKIQADSVLTANLSATKITSGTLNANNVSVVNLSATNITGGVLDANRVTVRNLDAESIVSQSIEARHIKSLNGLNINNQFKVASNGRVSIGNDRVTIDYSGITITRPDGVVWMQDGIANTTYAVGEFSPPFMDLSRYSFGGGNYEEGAMFVTVNKFWLANTNALLGENGYVDQRDRDKNWTVAFTRYEFSHDARYMVLGYRPAINTNNARHQIALFDIYDGEKLIHQQWFSRGGSAVQNIAIDLGKPTFSRKSIELRIGMNKSDQVNSSDLVRFRINRVFLTDNPQ